VLTAYLGDEVLPPVRVTEEVIAAGQRRGEVRADEPAEALGVIVLYAVLFSTQRGATIGRREGSSPPARPAAFTGAQHAFTSNQHAAASISSPLAATGCRGHAPGH